MLTEKDIQKLMRVFPTRSEVMLKSDAEKLRQDFSNLQSVVDGYVKRGEKHDQEIKAIVYRLGMHDFWIKQLAAETGTSLKD